MTSPRGGADQPWWHFLLPSFLPSVVAFVGFAVVHALSVRRQRRDETFRVYQAITALIREIANEAAEAWRGAPDAERTQSLVAVLPARFNLLGKKIHSFEKRIDCFRLVGELSHFRTVATRDIENPTRTPSHQRAQEVHMAANILEEALDQIYLEKFG